MWIAVPLALAVACTLVNLAWTAVSEPGSTTFAVAGGNPAKVIRERFDKPTVERLETIAWWDWPADKVTRHLELIIGADVDALERAS